jgi:hypothetical protein
VTHNVEANIALGGNISHNTLIVENEIKNSLGPGIIMVEGLANIYRNDVAANVDGIKLVHSSGKIRRNYIANNENDGVTC